MASRALTIPVDFERARAVAVSVSDQRERADGSEDERRESVGDPGDGEPSGSEPRESRERPAGANEIPENLRFSGCRKRGAFASTTAVAARNDRRERAGPSAGGRAPEGSPAHVADQLDVALSEVYVALSYYYANVDEMRELERANDAAFEEMQKSSLKPKEMAG